MVYEGRPAAPVDEATAEKAVERIASHQIAAAAGVALSIATLSLQRPSVLGWLPGAVSLLGAFLGAAGALRWPESKIDHSRYVAELKRRDIMRLRFVNASWGSALASAVTWYVLTLCG